jgi:hypothetical protein
MVINPTYAFWLPDNFGNFAVHTPNNFCDVFFVVADVAADIVLGAMEVT